MAISYDAAIAYDEDSPYDGAADIAAPSVPLPTGQGGASGGGGRGSYTHFRPSRSVDRDAEPSKEPDKVPGRDRRRIEVDIAAALMLMED